MSAPKRVELTFLGQALALRTDASPDYVRKLAKFVEERVAELKRAGVKDPLKALSLAALAGGRGPHAERVLASQRRDQPRADRLVGRLPVAPDAVRREGGDRARERLGFLARLALRHDPAREADALGLARVHRPAREDQIERAAEADDRRQSHRAAVEQRDAPAAVEDAHDRVLLDHAEVAPEGQLEAAGDGVARHGGDHRLAEPHARRAHGPFAVRAGVLRRRRRDGLEIEARAEGAVGAPEHGDARLAVALEGAERGAQRCGRRRVHRVPPLGSVEDDRRHGAVRLAPYAGSFHNLHPPRPSWYT